MRFVSLLLFSFIALSTHHSVAQRLLLSDSSITKSDAIETFTTVSTLDPNKASLYAAVFPGLGQIYNRQYWKLPIVYGGLMLFGHYINNRHVLYNAFRNAYLAETDGNENTVNPFGGRFGSATTLERNAEQLRRDRDYLMVLGTLYYLLSIVDAHIAAHLSEFDVNDDLSFEVRPAMYMGNRYTAQNIGVSLVFNLSK
ncbi:DUF5683 domain-containing protein [Reichenbachiella sp. MALMAid0571]|uniref:DUF5683 domain-containing protein n=1 Tax=Reichenbachiella sp. MALMAid0571 TaxID=3143939 RepID=UPI0032DFB53A